MHNNMALELAHLNGMHSLLMLLVTPVLSLRRHARSLPWEQSISYHCQKNYFVFGLSGISAPWISLSDWCCLLKDHVVVGVVERVASHHPHQPRVHQSLMGRPTQRLSWRFDARQHPEGLSGGNGQRAVWTWSREETEKRPIWFK